MVGDRDPAPIGPDNIGLTKPPPGLLSRHCVSQRDRLMIEAARPVRRYGLAQCRNAGGLLRYSYGSEANIFERFLCLRRRATPSLSGAIAVAKTLLPRGRVGLVPRNVARPHCADEAAQGGIVVSS